MDDLERLTDIIKISVMHGRTTAFKEIAQKLEAIMTTDDQHFCEGAARDLIKKLQGKNETNLRDNKPN